MKLKKVLSLILCVCMVLGMMSTVAFADENPVEVDTYEELLNALADSSVRSIKLIDNITASGSTQSNAYGTTGINILNGQTLDGNGHRLSIDGLNGTWDTAISTTGGTIKNLIIDKGFRGVFVNHNSTYSAPVVLENVTIDGPVYTISCDQGTNQGLTATDCTFNGWTSYAATIGEAKFIRCKFGEGSGNSYCRPYAKSEFEGCDFEEDYGFDITRTENEFNDCKYNDEPLDINNGSEMFEGEGDVVIDDEEITLVNNAVAYVGGTGYTDFKEALKNLGANQTLNLLSDVTIGYKWDCRDYGSTACYGTKAVPVTINGNGHTLKFIDKIDDGFNRLAIFRTEADATFKNLTVDMSDAISVFQNRFSAISSGTGDLTVENCKFIGSTTYTNGRAIIYGEGKDSTALADTNISVTNCEFINWNYGVIDNMNGSDVKTVKVTGSDFTNADIHVSAAKSAEITGNDMNGGYIKVTSYTPDTILAVKAQGNTLDAAFAADNSIIKAATLDVQDGFTAPTIVADLGGAKYTSIKQAILAAQPNDVIKLLGNVTEKVVIEAPAPSVVAIAENETPVIIDLNGNTLNGYILIKDANKVIEIKNGNIVNEDSAESAVESVANVTLTNVNVTSARHAVNAEGGELTINGGNYSLIPYGPGMTQNVIGVENAKATINGGTFVGPKGTTTDSGAAVAAKVGADVTINGGKFSGGKNNTLAKKDTAVALIVNGGSFDQDVSAYVADGKEVVKLGDDEGYKYPYIVTDKAASAITVDLAEAKDEDGKVIPGLYDIVLISADGRKIHEFVAAEFTFKNDSTTVGGSTMQYEVLGITEGDVVKTVAEHASKDEFNNDQYIIKVPDGADRLSSKFDFFDGHLVNMLKIGQVSFIGQGTINFSIAKGEVDTTWQNTNLGRYYYSNDGTLNIAEANIENGSVEDITRDVAVKVTYNHPLQNAWGENASIKVTLKDAYGDVIAPVDNNDISDGYAAFNNVKIGRITVTLEAPGFRKFVYETTLDEGDSALVLNFWNDVKKDAYKLPIETGKTPVAHNFVVGDIVMDYIVDKYDLAAVTSYYGMYNIANNSKYIMYDLNRDGNIDIRDVQYVLHTMGN